MRWAAAIVPLIAAAGLDCSSCASPVVPGSGAPAAPPSAAAHASSSASGAKAASPGPCPLRPACDAPFTGSFSKRPFKHSRSPLVIGLGAPRHRGRDLFLRPGDSPWVLAKFAYGPADKDLSDEEVDVWLERGCAGAWEAVGTFKTTKEEGSHSTVLGVEDKGGQLFVDLNTIKLPSGPLGVGRHRVHMAVAGDGSSADLILEILPAGAKIAVSDVDGTLTESENAIVEDVATGSDAAANPGAPDVLRALSERGYFVLYLTARPFWLVPRTRSWLQMQGFPPGILHTSLSASGYGGDEAAAFKMDELSELKANTGVVPEWAFGNKSSDVNAYASAGIGAAHSYFFKLEGDPKGGTRHEDYRTILSAFTALGGSCP